MKYKVVIIFVFFFSFCLNGQVNIEELTNELKQHFKSSELPGFSVAIVNDNKVLYSNSFGYANKEDKTEFTTSTLQNLGSVSKTVVGLALIKAIEDNVLTLDTEINEVLPFEVVNPYFMNNPILIKHLANHTSTILDTKHYGKSYVLDASFIERENTHQEFLGFIKSHIDISLGDFLYNILNKEGGWYKKKNFIKAKPGTENEYSNLNAALMALIIETVTGVPFQDYTEMKVFEPLKMTNTTWKLDKESFDKMSTPYFPSGNEVPRYRLITYPDGGLISSIDDLSFYLIEMIKAYAGASSFLSPEFAKLLFPGDNDNNRAFWGMGETSRNIGHGGSDPGVQTDLQFNADRKIGRIIICNVNAEDNEELWKQYRGIHQIMAKYEDQLN